MTDQRPVSELADSEVARELLAIERSREARRRRRNRVWLAAVLVVALVVGFLAWSWVGFQANRAHDRDCMLHSDGPAAYSACINR